MKTNKRENLIQLVKTVIKESDDIFGTLGKAINPNPTTNISPKANRVINTLKREYASELDVLDNNECISITESLIEFLSSQLRMYKDRGSANENVELSEAESDEPLFVKQARKLVADDTYGKLTDPATGKKITCDYGSAKLIVQFWDAIKPETKEKLKKVSLPVLVNKLWGAASFKR